MTGPQNIPVGKVAICAGLGLDVGPDRAIVLPLSRLEVRGDGEVVAGSRMRPVEILERISTGGLNELSGGERPVAELRLQSNVPVCVVLENKGGTQVLINDAVLC